MALSFTSILSKPVSEIKRPPTLPIGTYICQWVEYKQSQTEGKDGTKYDKLEITWSVLQADEDVDPEALTEFGGSVAGEKLRENILFNLSDERKFEGSLNILKGRFTSIGLPDDLSVADSLANAKGGFAKVLVGHRANPDNPEIVYTEIKGVYSAA